MTVNMNEGVVRRARIWALTALLATVALPLPAMAQDTADDASATAQAEEPEFGEILVTAQRRGENLSKVPIAIQAFDGDTLADTGTNGLKDLGAITPGLQVTEVNGGFAPYIRGVGSTNTLPPGEAPVATYVDGVYLAISQSANLDLNNVERVEVLKGPQGTLFGRNATGGLVNIVTRDPSETISGEVKAYVGNYRSYGGSVYLTGGLADGLAADFSGSIARQDRGFGRDVATSKVSAYPGATDRKISYRDDQSARLKLKWESGSTVITAAVDYMKFSDNRGVIQKLLPGSLGSDGGVAYGGCIAAGGTPTACIPVAQAAASRGSVGFNDNDGNLVGLMELESWGGYLKLKQEFDSFSVTSTTAYRHDDLESYADYDATSKALLDTRFTGFNRSLTQEVLLTSTGSGPFSWIVGGFYMRNRAGIDYLYNGLFVSAPIPGIAPDGVDFLGGYGSQKTKSYSGFADASYEVTDKLKLTGGIRYTADRRRMVSHDQIIPAGAGGPETPPVIPARYGDRENSGELTYRAVASYQASDDLLAYASYNHGFKSGGFNAGAPGSAPYQPEKIDAYEVGLKAKIFDRRIAFNAAGYYYDYSNLQVPVAGENGQYFILNAASAKMYGFDADANARITDHFSLYGGVAIMHARYKDFPGAISFLPTGYGEYPLLAINAGGNHLPLTPGVSFNVGANLSYPVGNGEAGATLNWSHTGAFYWEPDNRLKQGAYSLVNFSIGWKEERGLGVQLMVRNLFDKKYAASMASGSLGDVLTAAQPRTAKVEISYRF